MSLGNTETLVAWIQAPFQKATEGHSTTNQPFLSIFLKYTTNNQTNQPRFHVFTPKHINIPVFLKRDVLQTKKTHTCQATWTSSSDFLEKTPTHTSRKIQLFDDG